MDDDFADLVAADDVGVDLDAYAGDLLAHRSDSAGTGPIRSRHRGGLREPVTLVDGHPQCRDEVGNLRRDGCSSGDRIPKPPAKAVPDLGEHQLVVYPILQLHPPAGLAFCGQCGPLCGIGHCQVKDLLFGPALGGHQLLEPVVDAVVDRRYRHQKRRADVGEVVHQRVRRRQARRRARGEDEVKLYGLTKRVRPGQEGCSAIVGADVEQVGERVDVARQVGVGEHDTLWFSCCSGRVDQTGEAGRIRVHGVDPCFCPPCL